MDPGHAILGVAFTGMNVLWHIHENSGSPSRSDQFIKPFTRDVGRKDGDSLLLFCVTFRLPFTNAFPPK